MQNILVKRCTRSKQRANKNQAKYLHIDARDMDSKVQELQTTDLLQKEEKQDGNTSNDWNTSKGQVFNEN